ncbi:MAG TPA: hypothetical protein DDW52_21770 [Planctomycetaceae bacterium]|nr:hypothetical protein [Planctomycetaceae bacterium]
MTKLTFEGSIALAIITATLLCSLSVLGYRRQLLGSSVQKHWALWLPTLRCAAILLASLAIARPTIETRRQNQLPGEIVFLVDNSQSMLLSDNPTQSASLALKTEDQSRSIPSDSRLKRAFVWVREQIMSAGTSETAPKMRLIAASENGLQPIAIGSSEGERSEFFETENWPLGTLSSSPIDQWLQSPILFSGPQSRQATNRRAIILLSDGQRTTKRTTNESLPSQTVDPNTRIHTVGFGTRTALADVSIEMVELPEQITKTGRVTGKLVLFASSACPAAKTVRLSLDVYGKTVWSDEQALANGKSEIQVDFPAAAIPSRDAGSEQRALRSTVSTSSQPSGAEPLELVARAQVSFPEATLRNNIRQCVASVAQRASRVLILDQHSRWETRYLHNLFARHPGWEPELLIGQAGHFDRISRLDLGDFDLIVLGDITIGAISGDKKSVDFRAACRQHLSLGGGLVFIDGRENRLWSDNPISSWLPEKDEEAQDLDTRLPLQFQLRGAASAFAAFDLTGTSISPSVANKGGTNEALWETLVPPRFLRKVRPRDADEVLVTLSDTIDRLPVLLSRRLGAGHILYCGTDELWRWRYEVADEWHSRFWLQIAMWLQRPAARQENTFVTLETTRNVISIGEEIEIFCRLKQDTSKETKLVTVVISDDLGKIVERQPARLSADGSYQAQAKLFQPGNYHVKCEIEGYSPDALNIKLPFHVRQPANPEFTQTTCNEQLLKQLALSVGGTYRHESEDPQINDLIAELSGSQVESEVVPLWSTAGWLAAILAILSAEWFLRWQASLP